MIDNLHPIAIERHTINLVRLSNLKSSLACAGRVKVQRVHRLTLAFSFLYAARVTASGFEATKLPARKASMLIMNETVF